MLDIQNHMVNHMTGLKQMRSCHILFFFQAEDGIRDVAVTGVQTCALPILKKKLGPAPTVEEVFRTCLPAEHPQPPVKWSRAHSDTYVFMSPSNDLRFLGTMRLKANHIKDYPPPGTLVGVIGIAVGFGSNFLNAIYAENRLVLNNGSHRAYALRDLGVTHVPCIIQYPSTREELVIAASGDLRDHPDLYLRSPRPSMLKDYFNPKLRKIVALKRRVRQVTVKFETDEKYVPSL